MTSIPDPKQRAVLARQILANTLYQEVMASLKQRQIDIFLAGRPPDEVAKAQAIAIALKQIDDALASALVTEKLVDHQQKAQHRYAD